MGSEWRKVKLEELVAIEKRNINPQDYKDEYFLHYSIPAYDEGKCPKLEKGMNIKSNKFLIDHNYILLSKLNPRIDRVWLPKKLEKKYKQIASTEFIPLLPKANYDRVYCYYLLKFPQLRAFMVQNTKGTSNSHQRMDIHSVLNYEIEVPPLPEQQKIVSILSAFDDKIELNNEMNKTLEEIAQAIFKHWFIDFEFPNENGEPYKSSGGEFVDSELGPIPKGWKVKALDEIADFLNGLAMQKYRPKDESNYLPVLKIRELKQGITLPDSDKCSVDIDPRYIVDDGDVIFSWSGSLEVKIWCGGKAGLNQHLFKVSSDKYPKWFYYYWIKHYLNDFRRIAEDKATTMGHIKREHLNQAKVIVPDDEQLKQFDRVLSPLIEFYITNGKEVKTLSQLRDTLLPKLISGEIRVM